MKIEKVLLYYQNFPIRLLTDAHDAELKIYENRTGEKLSEQLKRDGQKEPIIINANRFDAKTQRSPSYIVVEPGGCRLSAMRQLNWKHCKAIVLTYNFMLSYLEKINFLHQKNVPVTRKDLGDYFSSIESPSFQWTDRFLNS